MPVNYLDEGKLYLLGNLCTSIQAQYLKSVLDYIELCRALLVILLDKDHIQGDHYLQRQPNL